MLSTTVEVIINCSAGSASRADAQLISELFGARGMHVKISASNRGSEILKLARRAADGDASTVVAAGGDGTVSAVASTLVGTTKTLGVIPLGTRNHFAKDLHIPLDLEAASKTILEGYATAIDVGEVNGRTFINNSSLALYPKIVQWRKWSQRLGYGKWPAFLWAVLTVLRRYPFLDVRLIADEKEFATRTPFVFIGNNEYEMEGFNIGKRARLDGGVLSLYVTRRVGRLGFMRLALRALFKRLRQSKDFEAVLTTEVLVETKRRRVRVATDGEIAIMRSPLHYRVLPRELRVIVPKSARE